MARQSRASRPKLVAEMREAIARLTEQARDPQLTSRQRQTLQKEIRATIDDLASLLSDIDPIRQPEAVFDPSNPKIVGRFVALALVAQPRLSLATLSRFYGSGVYAIYYTGDSPLYAPISGSETPIYVGQAKPKLANAQTPLAQGTRLSGRLTEHRKNIMLATTTLDIADFQYRSLVVQSGWETAAENYLIQLFRPIWNNETNILYGLGKHGDDSKTRANKRSPWDTMHPGRRWAAPTLLDAKTPDMISQELKEHFAEHPVFPDLDAVLMSFIEELRQA
jgi:hypothetical protein